MKKIYQRLELIFEKITDIVTSILGNSITFIIALGMVITWLSDKKFYQQDLHECLRDIFHAFVFLTLFIIQKSFNKFTAALHVKVNELVVSHEPANNAVVAVENKSEQELNEMSKEYKDLAEEKKEEKKGDEKNV